MIEEERYDISCIFGIFEYDVEKILVKIDTEERRDVEAELTERFEKDILRFTRGKIFDLAKLKITKDLENKGATSLLDDVTMFTYQNQSQLASRCVSQWEPVARRAKHKLASDAIHFLMFVLGQCEKFPTSLIKSTLLDKGEIYDPRNNKDLLSQFNHSLATATGPLEVNVVYTDNVRERHIVTIPCRPSGDPNCQSSRITILSENDSDNQSDTENISFADNSSYETDTDIDSDDSSTESCDSDQTGVNAITEVSGGASVRDPVIATPVQKVSTDSAVVEGVPSERFLTAYTAVDELDPEPETSLIETFVECTELVEPVKCTTTTSCIDSVPTCGEKDNNPAWSDKSTTSTVSQSGNTGPETQSTIENESRPIDLTISALKRKDQQTSYDKDSENTAVKECTTPPEQAELIPTPIPRPSGCRGICGNCGAGVLLWECLNQGEQHLLLSPSFRTIASSTEDFKDHLEMEARANPASSGDKPVSRAEYDAYTDYTDRVVDDTEKKVADILKWKAMINSKVNRIEASVKRSEKLGQSHTREIWEKLDQLKMGANVPATRPEPRHKQQKPPTKQSTDHMQNQNNKGESVWDNPNAGEPGGPVDPIPVSHQQNSYSATTRNYTSTPRVGSNGPNPMDARDQPPNSRPKGTTMKANNSCRTPGVVFFTPKPQREASREKAPGNTTSKVACPETIDTPLPKARHLTQNRQSSMQHGISDTREQRIDPPRTHLPVDVVVAGKDQLEPIDLTNPNVDMSGMSDSWYDDEGSDDDGVAELVDTWNNGATSTKETMRNEESRTPYSDMARKPASPTPDNRTNRKPRENNNNSKPSEYGRKVGAGTPRPNEPNKPDDRHRKIVTRSGWYTEESRSWQVEENKKRKRERSGNKFVPDLKAAPSATCREIYVQGLDYSECMCHADLEDIVFKHCRVRGYHVIDLCTIPKAKSRVEAGCKVTVKSEDYDDLMDPNFWPSDTTVREWEFGPRHGKNAEGEEIEY